MTLTVRTGQQRLLRLRCFGDERAAVAVGRGDEASGHVVAEERDARGMAAIGHRQRAAGGAQQARGERKLKIYAPVARRSLCA